MVGKPSGITGFFVNLFNGFLGLTGRVVEVGGSNVDNLLQDSEGGLVGENISEGSAGDIDISEVNSTTPESNDENIDNLIQDEGSSSGGDSTTPKSNDIDNLLQDEGSKSDGYDSQASESSSSGESISISEVSNSPRIIDTNTNNNRGGVEDKNKKCYLKKWKFFKDLDRTEKVATLNQETGETEWNKPTDYQAFDNSKLGGEMYSIKTVDEDGNEGKLVVSEKHKVYSSNYSLGKTLNPDNDRMNNFPLSSECLTDLNNFFSEKCNESINGGFISKNIIPNDSFGGNLSLFKKSLSRVNITLCSDLALSNIFGSLDLNLTRITSDPSLSKELIRPTGIFSSAINEISSCDKSFIFNSLVSQFETCKNSFSIEFWVIFFNNSFNCNSGTEKSDDILDEYSSIYEGQISTTDFRICNNMLINLNSHCKDINNEELYKSFGLQPITEVYSQFNNGEDVWFMGSSGEPIRVKGIEKVPYDGMIYDVTADNHVLLVRRRNDNIDNLLQDKVSISSEESISSKERSLSESNLGDIDKLAEPSKFARSNSDIITSRLGSNAESGCGSDECVDDSTTPESNTNIDNLLQDKGSISTSENSGCEDESTTPESNDNIDNLLQDKVSISSEESISSKERSLSESNLGDFDKLTEQLASEFARSELIEDNEQAREVEASCGSDGCGGDDDYLVVWSGNSVQDKSGLGNDGVKYGDVYYSSDWLNSSLVGYWHFDNLSSYGENDTLVKDFSGHCYDNETKILTDKGWKYFKDLDKTEKVMTLNQETGESEYQLPYEWQEFDNDELGGEMYKVVTSEGELVVSEKHRVYSNSDISNLSGYNFINLPSKFSEGFSSSNLENADINNSGLLCGILLNHTTENIFSLGNFEGSSKWWSFVINTLCSDLENSANIPFESFFGLNDASNPCCLRNFSSSFFTFSSNKNFILCRHQFELPFCEISSKLQGCLDMLFSEGNKISSQNLIDGCSCFKQFKNLPDHDSGSFESRGSTTDFIICNNIIIDFYSHCKEIIDDEVYKFYGCDELVVSEKHRVYSSISKNFLTSLSSNTSTESCFFNLGSLDQIGALSRNKDKANKGASLRCGESFLDLYSDLGMISTNFNNNAKIIENCSLFNPQFFNTFCFIFSNSSNIYCGTNNFTFLSFKDLNISLTEEDFGWKNANKTLVSMINILNHCSLIDIDNLSFLVDNDSYAGESSSTTPQSHDEYIDNLIQDKTLGLVNSGGSHILLNLDDFNKLTEQPSEAGCRAVHNSCLLATRSFSSSANSSAFSSVSSDFSCILSDKFHNISLSILSVACFNSNSSLDCSTNSENFLILLNSFLRNATNKDCKSIFHELISLSNSEGIVNCVILTDNIGNQDYLSFVVDECGELVVSEKHRVYSSERKKEKRDLSLVSPIMVVKVDNFNNSFVFIKDISEDKTFEDVDSSLTREFVSEGFEMFRIFKNSRNFSREGFIKFPIFGTCFCNPFFNTLFVFENHSFQKSSFVAVLEGCFSESNTLLTNSSLYSSSSTGCQSICSQNSQSSSVTSRVSLYLLDMSCLMRLINAFPSSFGGISCNSLGSNNCETILTNNNENEDYLSFVVDECGELITATPQSYESIDNLILDMEGV